MSRMISRILLAAGLAVVLAFATGCVEATMLVKVKTDGSGTMQQRVSVHPSFATNMQNGGLNPSEDQLREQASSMGMRFVAVRKITRKNGWQGVVVDYEFDDIGSVKLMPDDSQMKNPLTQQAAGYTFDFKINGDVRELIVKVPSLKPETPEGAMEIPMETPPAALTNEQKAQFRQAVAMLKPYARDVKMNIVIAVDGTITETNATYRSQMHPNMVQLLEVDFAKIVENEDTLMKVTENAGSVKDVPGIRAQTEPLSVSFH